ncbi:Alpha-galactosidase [Venustampulla echinocandica]|uniref:Alpha-galactosidase n=1 Tax=Venustampulla echinocandica TaxID=2656787 RepID=A0A370T9M2_9HELO|nr:Alpha-galactosidase [Venustampulla echinocandica]RDL30359.1 Alpha-galactosidase [Venustampulla echinocandica]
MQYRTILRTACVVILLATQSVAQSQSSTYTDIYTIPPLSAVPTFTSPLAISTTISTGPNLSNGLAQTPPMGWSSWNGFGPNINETLLRDTIDTIASNGLMEAGFVYVNLDDGWQHYLGNRLDHPLEADPVKFPSGIKALADYAHSKGLKLGIYSGPGQTTCAGYTGSQGHEAEDAKLFASWGIDHLKYDSCCAYQFAPKSVVQQVILSMSQALLASGRPIVYHACHCGWADSWEWAAQYGANQWRIGQDISDDFDYPGNRMKYFFDVLDLLDRGNSLAQFSGPGHWNDYDMLIIGLNGKSQHVGAGCSNVEYRTHFSMWAMVCSPLLIGSDVRALSSDSMETLTNPEIIAISQDLLGQAAATVGVGNQDGGTLQVYAKAMEDGSYAVALLNRGGVTADMSISPQRDLTVAWDKYTVRDVWKHETTGPYDTPYMVEVIGHEAKILRLYEVVPNATMPLP